MAKAPAKPKGRSGAPKGNQNAKGNRGGNGGPQKYDPKFAAQAEKACQAGFTDMELADLLGVNVRTINEWKAAHIEFGSALKAGKAEADARVERSLFARANGYEHEEVDIRVVSGEIVQTPIRRYYPPDTTAAIFWLKNRRPQDWRDKTDVEHSGTIGVRQAQDMSDEELATIAAGGSAGAAGSAKGSDKPPRVH